MSSFYQNRRPVPGRPGTTPTFQPQPQPQPDPLAGITQPAGSQADWAQANQPTQHVTGMQYDQRGRPIVGSGIVQLQPAAPQPGNAAGQIGQAISQDVRNADAARLRNEGQITKGIADLEGAAGRAGEAFATAQKGASDLRNLAGDMTTLGDAQSAQFNQTMEKGQAADLAGIDKSLEGLGAVDQRFSEIGDSAMKAGDDAVSAANQDAALAMKYGDSAIAEMRTTKAEQQDLRAQQISAAHTGLTRRWQSDLQSIEASGMTPEQKADAKQRAWQSVAPEAFKTVTDINGQFNQTMERVGTNLSQMIRSVGDLAMQGGQLKQGAYGTKGQMLGIAASANQGKQESVAMRQRGAEAKAGVRQNWAGQLLQSQAGRREVMGMVGEMGKAWTSLQQSGKIQELQLQAEGRNALAQYRAANPFGFTAVAPAIAQMIAASTTQGLSQTRGVSTAPAPQTRRLF